MQEGFSTRKGFIGLKSRSLQPGDRIYIFSCGRVHFALRNDGRDFRPIGEGYVQGLMHGQAIYEDTKFEELILH